MHIAALNIEIVATVSIRAGNEFSRILKCLDRSLNVKAFSVIVKLQTSRGFVSSSSFHSFYISTAATEQEPQLN